MRLFFVSLLALIPASVSATTIPTPPGLHPGDVYERVFVTSQVFSVTTIVSDPPITFPFPNSFGGIKDADYWVTVAAHDGGLLPNWTGQTLDYTAILSDSTVNAKDRLNIQGPIYNMQNELIATSAADLWSGSIHNAIRYDEFGNSVPATTIQFVNGIGNVAKPTAVWTGTAGAGVKDPFNTCGNWSNPNTEGSAGDPFTTTVFWITGYVPLGNTVQHFYGISGPITVVPEPSSIVLAMMGFVALLRFRRRRHSPAPTEVTRKYRI